MVLNNTASMAGLTSTKRSLRSLMWRGLDVVCDYSTRAALLGSSRRYGSVRGCRFGRASFLVLCPIHGVAGVTTFDPSLLS